MMRNRLLLAAIAGLSLCLAGAPALALSVDTTGTADSTTDDGGVGGGGFNSAGSTVDASSVGSETISDIVGESVTVTPRVRGHVAAVDGDERTQTLDVSFVYEITAASFVSYDVTFAPEFHGILKIADNAADDVGDRASFHALAASLDSVATSSLDLGSFTSQTTDGFQTVDWTATGETVGASGSNTFTLTYSVNLADNPILFEALSLGGGSTCTQSGAMWGMDAGLSPSLCSGASDFLDYNSAANRAADGLFGAATVTITAVPEPGTLLLLGSGLAGLALVGRPRA